MRMSEGVEWGLHCCLTLAWLDDRPVPSARLAALFDISPTYLNKCLQRLVRAGILASTPGPRGGVQLARAPKDITLMDVVVALEGRETFFSCTEIRQQGEAGADTSVREFAQPCGIATAMRRAEMAWRRELAGQTLDDLMASAPVSSARRVRGSYDRISTRAGS
ncbi:Rrf2 family transcriptional regulator [Streptomyces sp. CFMR 7]|uniref:RrF2 family transcriptional regulator n=1 Tax=Streptomyces sp. CFMR 7 TaxID=1649184 RepID=UPI0006AD48D5|nr:Rrf2 family transcriptional regulator [Streptomyces sp. CFMR 7]ALC32342.1 Rrf2 family transcriptional regulator [Streptomyces sp. CFMR 7]